MTTLAPLLAGFLLAAPSPDPCAAIDLTPAFWKFWDAAGSLPAAERERLFEERVMAPNRAVYAAVFHDAPRPLKEIVNGALDRLPAVERDARALSARLAAELPGAIARFREAFPQFRCRTPVYVLYSAGLFDHTTQPVSGTDALLFGIDEISRRKEPLSPVLVHELFHVYHAQRVTKTPDVLYWRMWSEGLASYVSGRLNSDESAMHACCLPAAAPIDAALGKIIVGALERLDSNQQEDDRRYFEDGAEEIDIPRRSGWLLGYRVAVEAGKTRSLEELADMDPTEVRELVEDGLRLLESQTH
jgi:hypothetical protein